MPGAAASRCARPSARVARAGHDADGARRRGRPGAGARARRRRLPDQAVQPADAAGARQGAAAPRRHRGRRRWPPGRVSLDLEAHAISIAGGAPIRLTKLETAAAADAAGAGGRTSCRRTGCWCRCGDIAARATGSCSSSSCIGCGRRSRADPAGAAAAADRVRRRLSPESLSACAYFFGVDLVEHAAVGEVLLLRLRPAAEVRDRHQLHASGNCAAYFAATPRIARPVVVLRDDFLAFRRVQVLEVGARHVASCRGAAPPCRPPPPAARRGC